MRTLSYRHGNDLELDTVIELYRASTLGERRPAENRQVMRAMIENANLTITAWDGERLVGIARSLTDYAYVAYLADLAVHVDYQRKGIGRELVERTRECLAPTCAMVLLAAPLANDYYPKLGFEPNPRAWMLAPRVDP